MRQFFDEMSLDGAIREPYRDVMAWIEARGVDNLNLKAAEAEDLFRRVGITFAVYGENSSAERLIPFDVIPRVFLPDEWEYLERGVKQRAQAINAFLWDVYHDAEFIRAGHIPEELIYRNSAFCQQMQGFDVPQGIYSHIAGVDIVRTDVNDFHVLEDNCRTPSGVSYMLENREIMMRMFPDLLQQVRVRPVEHYTDLLQQTLASVAPAKTDTSPVVVILTPGSHNSAYYEHSFLADQMGVALVEGTDLFIDGEFCFMRTTAGPKKVDVIYRRIDDSYLDPLCFNRDSMLGIPGLMNVYLSGGVQICSAPGAGIADDKAVYTYVPEMIRFYLGEEPIIENVATWRCGVAEELRYVLENLSELVVKEVHGSGGYGMLIGPLSTKQEIEDYRARILADPAGFIAQPTLSLSTSPTLVEKGIVSRHVDLRPFCLMGKECNLVPGGLTRVALKEGSLVVNSSQGGGVKDSWVLAQ